MWDVPKIIIGSKRPSSDPPKKAPAQTIPAVNPKQTTKPKDKWDAGAKAREFVQKAKSALTETLPSIIGRNKRVIAGVAAIAVTLSSVSLYLNRKKGTGSSLLDKVNIDFPVVEKLEGGVRPNWRLKCIPYFDKKGGLQLSSSGITTKHGVDLGQYNKYELGRMKISESLQSKCEPYLLKKGRAAIDLWNKKPLDLTEDECLEIYHKAAHYTLTNFIARYDKQRARGSEDFQDLPRPIQTVLFSLAWNLGDGFPIKAGWRAELGKAIYKNDFEKIVKLLENSTHKEPGLRNRRNAEAEYLRRELKIH